MAQTTPKSRTGLTPENPLERNAMMVVREVRKMAVPMLFMVMAMAIVGYLDLRSSSWYRLETWTASSMPRPMSRGRTATSSAVNSSPIMTMVPNVQMMARIRVRRGRRT